MAVVNCDNYQCPYNRPHPIEKYRGCFIDMLSIVENQCEFWQSYSNHLVSEALLYTHNSEAKNDV